jgi:hypothetical protein
VTSRQPSDSQIIGAFAFIVFAFLVLPIGSLVLGVRELRYYASDLEPVQCRPGQSGRCLDGEQAVVEESISDGDQIRVRHDDGRHTMDVFVDWDPPRGHRVVLERWHGRVVAVYDPSREERHKTSEWPGPSQIVVPILMIVVGAAFLGPVLYGVGIRLVHAVKRRADAT